MPHNQDNFEQALEDLKRSVNNNLDSKRRGAFSKWLKDWSFYIRRESNFRPHQNRKYNRGDIITVRYGYNVGSEQGGNRPSVVLEDNDLSDKTIMVVPLSSLSADETEDDVHEKNAYLGELEEFNVIINNPPGTKNKALIHQMRAVSKQRIIRPKSEEEDVFRLDKEKFHAISQKIKQLYT